MVVEISYILLACGPGQFGDNCEQICSSHCTQTGQICASTSGTCLSRCVQGGLEDNWYTGDTCNITISKCSLVACDFILPVATIYMKQHTLNTYITKLLLYVLNLFSS